ncbi:MAG: DUF924 family protein [Spongiibacteraceae bacterium]
MHFQEVIDFWYSELDESAWWQKSEQLDLLIATRFADIHRAATAGELYSWRHSALGRLAEIIVLDQFSRNIYRDTPASFAADGQALALAQEAIRHGAPRELTVEQCLFLYMPYMHSESLAIQRAALCLFESLGLPNNAEFAQRHYDIIERFNRYPHRNAILGRESSEQEEIFLREPGSSF